MAVPSGRDRVLGKDSLGRRSRRFESLLCQGDLGNITQPLISLSYSLCETGATRTPSHWVAEMTHLNAQHREPVSVCSPPASNGG